MKEQIRRTKPSGAVVIAAIVLVVAVVAAALVLWWPQKADLKHCPYQEFRCYANFYEQRTKQTSAKTAISELRSAYTYDQYIKAECHQLTHAIGHAAFAKYGSLAAAYKQGDNFCWSGYYHGVTEEAMGKLGPAQIRTQANTVCAELAQAKPRSFDHYNCVHGMGHGFFTVGRANLFTALQDCNLLKDDWEKEACYGGVFMENVMIETRGDGTSAYLKPSEPLYPCTVVADQYKTQCYLMQTSYVLQHNGYDFKKTFAVCQNGPDSAYATICFESIGRDASGSTNSNTAKTLTNCQQAPSADGLEHCMLGAVRDFISYFHSDQAAKQLCQAFGNMLEPRCLQEVKLYYATF